MPFLDLKAEILVSIALLLNLSSFSRLGRVSKSLLEILPWEALMKRDFPLLQDMKTSPTFPSMSIPRIMYTTLRSMNKICFYDYHSSENFSIWVTGVHDLWEVIKIITKNHSDFDIIDDKQETRLKLFGLVHRRGRFRTEIIMDQLFVFWKSLTDGKYRIVLRREWPRAYGRRRKQDKW